MTQARRRLVWVGAESSGDSAVKREQRFTSTNPCPICDGSQDVPSGNGGRCGGYFCSNGTAVVCMSVESDHEAGDSGGWVHALAETPREAAQTRGSDAVSTEVEAVYEYQDEHGTPVLEVVRFAGKQFRQRLPGAARFGGIAGATLVPYRLPQVLAAIGRGDRIYVVEGEKDVHAVEDAGAAATCNPMGAGKWRDEYSEYLRDAEVVIVADRDDGPGMSHARAVRLSLLGVAASAVIVEAAAGKDAHGHLAAGHALEQLSTVAGRFERVALGSYEPVPVTWLHEPVLIANAYTLVTAPAGVGKTMLALALAKPVVQAGLTVVYLDQENGPDVIAPRGRAFGLSTQELDRIAYFPYPSASRVEVVELVAEIIALGPTLVVFDAKANFLASAELDEDSSMDNTAWHSQVIQPLQRAGAAVLDLDHTGHRSDGRPRGSSAKEAVAEASWYLSTDRQFDKNNTATATLKRGLKNRRGALPPELQFTIGGDGNGGFIFAPQAEVQTGERSVRRRRMKEDIGKVVQAHWEAIGEPLSITAICKAVTGQRTEVSDAAQELGATPKSGFEITTGPRSAVLLRPAPQAS